jgi:hypothetical protein
MIKTNQAGRRRAEEGIELKYPIGSSLISVWNIRRRLMFPRPPGALDEMCWQTAVAVQPPLPEQYYTNLCHYAVLHCRRAAQFRYTAAVLPIYPFGLLRFTGR